MRVSLAPASRRDHRTSRAGAAVNPALKQEGPEVIVGRVASGLEISAPITPDAATLFGPRGAFLAGPSGPLFVCDTGHHRLMVWRERPSQDGATADFQIGQASFGHEGRNGRGPVGPATFNVPTGVAAEAGILAVADAWNHRILIWHAYPDHENQPADVVLGQADFSGGLANRGSAACAADSLNWCYGVSLQQGKLIVCDTGNRRVLLWNSVPKTSGVPADIVFGQADFVTRDENAGGNNPALGMRWPHAAAIAGDQLLVADAGNNRVMVWRNLPHANGMPCDLVLGQADFAQVDHNRAAYYPTANAFNMPYGAAVSGDKLLVTDTANSRLLSFPINALAMGCDANAVSGQFSFADKGDNRWMIAARDSLCWPYTVTVCGSTAVVADSGNNRILLWEVAA